MSTASKNSYSPTFSPIYTPILSLKSLQTLHFFLSHNPPLVPKCFLIPCRSNALNICSPPIPHTNARAHTHTCTLTHTRAHAYSCTIHQHSNLLFISLYPVHYYSPPVFSFHPRAMPLKSVQPRSTTSFPFFILIICGLKLLEFVLWSHCLAASAPLSTVCLGCF